MTNQFFSVDDLIKIIEAASRHQVFKLELSGVKIVFKGNSQPQALEYLPPTPEQEQEAKLNEAKTFALNEAEIKLRDLENLRLSDPEAFEDLIAKGELDSAGQESNGTLA